MSEDDYGYRFRVANEAERLAEARMKSLAYQIERFGVRCARIACGLAMLFGAIVVIGNINSVSDTPFSQLTFGMLARNALGWLIGLGLVWWAFVAAFGAAPGKSEVARALAGEAVKAVDAAQDRERMNT